MNYELQECFSLHRNWLQLATLTSVMIYSFGIQLPLFVPFCLLPEQLIILKLQIQRKYTSTLCLQPTTCIRECLRMVRHSCCSKALVSLLSQPCYSHHCFCIISCYFVYIYRQLHVVHMPVFWLIRGQFWVFPIVATHCTDWGDSWREGVLHAKFHPSWCRSDGVNPQNGKFYQNVRI